MWSYIPCKTHFKSEMLSNDYTFPNKICSWSSIIQIFKQIYFVETSQSQYFSHKYQLQSIPYILIFGWAEKQEADQIHKLWKLSCKLYEYITIFHLLPAKVHIIPEFYYLKDKEPHKCKVVANRFFLWYMDINEYNEMPYHPEDLRWKVMCPYITPT